MGIVQDVEFNEYSTVSRTHPVAMMVELFGSSGSESCSGPVLGVEFMADEILNVVHMI
jgi:hypothetical protein